MINYSRPLSLILALAIALCGELAIAQWPMLHDFEELADDRYRPSGLDPYMIFALEPRPESSSQENSGLALVIHIEPLAKPQNPQIQIFWATDEEAFQTHRRLDLAVQAGENRFFLPFESFDDELSKIRLDLDGCNCALQLTEFAVVPSTNALEADIPSALEHFLTVKNGLNIELDDWRGVELSSSAKGEFGFSGWDPRIINETPFDVPIDRYAGVFFEFNYDLQRPYQTYEIFWYLEGLSSNARRSAHFLLAGNKVARYKVYVPFERIYTQRKLNHLRFDFEACESCVFQLLQARLVGHAEAIKYQAFKPDRLYVVHTERAPAGKVRSEIIQKLLVDKRFFIFYLLLILSLLWGFWKRFYAK
jgi:hypothetical protein